MLLRRWLLFHLAEKYPYETIAMVGDGITDLEAVQISGGADLFVGCGPSLLAALSADLCCESGLLLLQSYWLLSLLDV
jgi:phosphoglycolate phosphatase-like HAD superfamily hydrolase